jgi:hypothetical protein
MISLKTQQRTCITEFNFIKIIGKMFFIYRKEAIPTFNVFDKHEAVIYTLFSKVVPQLFLNQLLKLICI